MCKDIRGASLSSIYLRNNYLKVLHQGLQTEEREGGGWRWMSGL